MSIIFDTDRIRTFIDKKNAELLLLSPKRKLLYSGSHFARENDINKVSFNAMMSRGWIPSLENAYKIAKGMNCKIEDLII